MQITRAASVSVSTSTTTSAPPPEAAPPSARPHLSTLTEDRWNHFCTQRFGVLARFGQDAYDVGCAGVDRAFETVTDVCNAEFRT